MDKKKKIIVISVIVGFLVIVTILGIVFNNKDEGEYSASSSRTARLYNELANKNMYSFKTTLDDDNSMFYAKKDNVAYVDTLYQGNDSKFVVKDGNSYLLRDVDKIYYTYENNDSDANMVQEALENVKDLKYEKGKEAIEGKTYNYEEYDISTAFSFKYFDEETSQDENEDDGEEDTTSEESMIKTRFYYNGNELVYIKTIAGDNEELLKVEIQDTADDKLFEIPSDYSER